MNKYTYIPRKPDGSFDDILMINKIMYGLSSCWSWNINNIKVIPTFNFTLQFFLKIPLNKYTWTTSSRGKS